jgi:AcrR family transcriptional regulator
LKSIQVAVISKPVDYEPPRLLICRERVIRYAFTIKAFVNACRYPAGHGANMLHTLNQELYQLVLVFWLDFENVDLRDGFGISVNRSHVPIGPSFEIVCSINHVVETLHGPRYDVNQMVEAPLPASLLQVSIQNMKRPNVSKQAQGAAHDNQTVPRPKTGDRRQEVILAAFQSIADLGFEGLRMRAIAKLARMDHATLHYYFSGKEALIQGVLEYIVRDLSIGRPVSTDLAQLPPRERLANHFSELVKQVREQPEIFVVLAEINVRSLRDETIRKVLIKYNRSWKSFLSTILLEGVQQKEFQSSINPHHVADLIISLFRGLSTTSLQRPDPMKCALDQLLAWLSVDHREA